VIATPFFDALWPRPLDESAPHAFALVDAARDARIYPALLRADCEWLCLYRGDAAVSMAEAAPYLVELDPHAEFTEWMLQHRLWCVFVHAQVSLEHLVAHFRRLVMAQLPDGRLVYFRFYDPRVLRVYLPHCTPSQREVIFGPVEQYVFESEDGDCLMFAPLQTAR
jgi:hypothetical protein